MNAPLQDVWISCATSALEEGLGIWFIWSDAPLGNASYKLSYYQ